MFGRILSSRPAQIALAILAALFALKLYGRNKYKAGRADEKDYLDKAANEAAANRRESRDQIDIDVRRVGAAGRLRDKWSRD